MPDSFTSAQPRPRRRLGPAGIQPHRLTAIAVAAITVGVLVWLLLIRDGGSDDTLGGPQARKSVEIVPATKLAAAVSEAGYPVYWFGRRPGMSYELTLITDGRSYLRYLPQGVPTESASPYLTVSSYSLTNAYEALERLGRRPGNEIVDLPDGGIALTATSPSTGIYVAFPGVDTEIEVFDPQQGRALRLARSGTLTPIG